MNFYYPYNFIPADSSDTPSAPYDYPFGTHAIGASQLARHDLWQPNHLSGCIICCLKTVTPTIVGNQHTPGNGTSNSPVTVAPYQWRGKTAIPANSLRGMIASTMEAISQSSLRVLDENYWPAFENIHSNLSPWHDKRCRDHGLTPAELLLGTVEDKEQQEGRNDGHSLASRIRFHDALLAEPEAEDRLLAQQTLVELASPKPEGESKGNFKTNRPSPYFDSDNGGQITYDEVSKKLRQKDGTSLRPHGRKFYLLHHPGQVQKQNYVSKLRGSKKRKMRCQPIMEKTTFYFHLSFDNISRAELTLLLKSLEPSATHQFRIGLGKSLGLGIVTLKIARTLLTTASIRYSLASIMEPRKYHYQLAGKHQLNSWVRQSRYRMEAKNVNVVTQAFKPDNRLINEIALCQLQRSGDIKQVRTDAKIRWRKGCNKDEVATPLPPLSSNPDHLPRYGEQPCQPIRNYIIAPNEKITPANQWVRETLAAMSQHLFTELKTTEIENLLTGLALAKKWAQLPQTTADEIQLKSSIKKLILASATKRGWENHWFISRNKRSAKKKYDGWHNENQ